MGKYVDAFVIPIKKTNLAKYKKMAKDGCKAWIKHGALSYYECVGDEFQPYGLGFKKLCKLKKDETFVFAYIVFKSKSHRNSVNKKVFAEMGDAYKDMKMPFDMKRFSVAGCTVLVNSKT
ncbi:MAG: DUF1428 domain-containing protein [Deltaproteobacteria bacterium]|nr:DUF1428 domain-containing protein [Deltaproteobacteria bacterium]